MYFIKKLDLKHGSVLTSFFYTTCTPGTQPLVSTVTFFQSQDLIANPTLPTSMEG